jgi:hypothetical protein
VLIKDWLNLQKTKDVLAYLHSERQKHLESILSSADTVSTAARVIGFSQAINTIERMEEKDVPDSN